MSVYDRIKNAYESLTKSERKVAKYCLDHYADIRNLPLSQLADNAGCGEATIVRFCRKIQCASYLDFREEMTEEARGHTHSQGDSFVDEIYHNVQASIEYAIENLDLRQIDVIAEKMDKADKIFCAGVGNSGISAEACAMRLVRNGKNGIYFKDTHFQAIYLNELHSRDVAVLFSNSGESYDMLHLARILRKKQVTVVGVTSSVVNSLAKLSDYCILSRKWIGPLGGGSMIGQITQLFIADLLSTRVGMLNEQATMRSKERTYDYIVNKIHLNGKVAKTHGKSSDTDISAGHGGDTGNCQDEDDARTV